MFFGRGDAHPGSSTSGGITCPTCSTPTFTGPTEATGDCTYYKNHPRAGRQRADPHRLCLREHRGAFAGRAGPPGARRRDRRDLRAGRVAGAGLLQQPRKDRPGLLCPTPCRSITASWSTVPATWGRVNQYGEILYVARKDNQIKHMGHRIELGEIETAIAALEGIRRVCCLYDQARGKIVAVYEGDLDRTQVIDGIKHALPKVHDPQRLPPGGGYAHQPERQDRPRPPDGGVHPCKGLTSWQQYLDLKAEAKARGLTLSNLYFLPGQGAAEDRRRAAVLPPGPGGGRLAAFWTRAGGFLPLLLPACAADALRPGAAGPGCGDRAALPGRAGPGPAAGA